MESLKNHLDRNGYPRGTVCVNCGKSLKHDRRRSTNCSKECADIVSQNYYWDWIRHEVLAKHPVCQHEGCIMASEEVHHTIPIYLGGHPWDRENLVALCFGHHNQMHTKEAEMKAIGKINHSQSSIESFSGVVP